MKLTPNHILFIAFCTLMTGCTSFQFSDVDTSTPNKKLEQPIQASSNNNANLPIEVKTEAKPESHIIIRPNVKPKVKSKVKSNVNIATQPQIKAKIKTNAPPLNKAQKLIADVKPVTKAITNKVPKVTHHISAYKIPQVHSVSQINSLTNENPTSVGEAKKPYLATQETIKTQHFGLWKLTPNWDGEHPGHCGLFTPTMQIDQDNYSTQVWLGVIDDKLLVNTSTNIDINKPGVGIQANDGKLQLFAQNRFANNAVWSGSLANTLKTNNKLNIILGGNELGQGTQEIAINLADLKKAYPRYQKCK